MVTVILLACSNVFMNLAWYGHLKWFGGAQADGKNFRVLVLAIMTSWGLAFFEYCLQVPANRLGYDQGYSAYQLKIIQEALSIGVFMVIAWFMLGEGVKWNHLVAITFILLAVCFAMWPKEAVDS
jgi:uncharacterized protein (DUF486 family)